MPNTLRVRAVALLVTLCGLVSPVGALAASSAQSSKLASADWSVNASPNLAAKPPSKKTINKFLRSLMSSYEEEDSKLCSFRFADLRHDGNLTLVAGSDSSGRELCSTVDIIDKTSSGFEIHDGGFATGAGADVSYNIQDVGKDGKLEYVIGWGLGTIKGRCDANWPVIYSWSGDGYKNVSDRYKDFYRKQLDSINKTISSDESQKECLLAEVAAIQRFLGVSSEAGLDQAIRLASSKDPAERAFAADLLGGSFAPSVGHRYLETLAKDSDRDVSDEAKYFLTPTWKGPLHPMNELARDQGD